MDYNASLELVESINDKYRSIDEDRGKLQKHRLMMQARLEEMRAIQDELRRLEWADMLYLGCGGRCGG